MMKRLLLILVVVLIALPLFGGGQQQPEAAAQSFEATFAHVVRPTIAKGQAADMFAEMVAERSGGRITINVFPDSQLGNDREITE